MAIKRVAGNRTEVACMGFDKEKYFAKGSHGLAVLIVVFLMRQK
jgi:hypothetical protein